MCCDQLNNWLRTHVNKAPNEPTNFKKISSEKSLQSLNLYSVKSREQSSCGGAPESIEGVHGIRSEDTQ